MTGAPDDTAVRVALWRALHVRVDPPAAGFKEARHVSTTDLTDRYFRGRSDGLRLSSGEEFLIAEV